MQIVKLTDGDERERRLRARSGRPLRMTSRADRNDLCHPRALTAVSAPGVHYDHEASCLRESELASSWRVGGRNRQPR